MFDVYKFMQNPKKQKIDDHQEKDAESTLTDVSAVTNTCLRGAGLYVTIEEVKGSKGANSLFLYGQFGAYMLHTCIHT